MVTRINMDILGIVEGITSDGHALVRCENIPELGASVFDGKRRIGTVRRLLGPVDSPYASIVGDSINRGLEGKKVFFDGGRDGQAKKKYHRS